VSEAGRVQSVAAAIGATLSSFTLEAGYALALTGRAIRWMGSPRQVWRRRAAIYRQMFVAGVESLPVTLVVGIFIGFLLSLSAGVELARYGQQAIVGQLVAVSVCREFGPFMTGLILAANVGSSMAAELGTMKVSEEIDALEVMSIEPARYLVLPRLVAMALMTPLLTIFTDAVAILGGGIIATVSCAQGLRTTGGAVGVGKATRTSVILCYLLILIFGYFGTAVFYGKNLG
jgi:phospholipid/cholesterol/gamma-HCH transport system permease protein